MHETVVGGGSAIHAKFRYRCSRIAAHGIEQIRHLICDALQRCPSEVACSGAASESKDRAARVGIPMGRSQSHEGRDEKYTAVVRHRVRQRFDFMGSSNHPQSVAQPLDDRAAHKDAAFEGILGYIFDFPGNRSNQPIGGRHRASTSVLQHETSGAVGIFRQAGMGASLAKQRRLLIPGNACERNSFQSLHRTHFSVNLAGGSHIRHH